MDYFNVIADLGFSVILGGGPRVVVSTAAFHAWVRGSVPGLGGLKETKMFLLHPRVTLSIVGSLRDREAACSASDLQGLNFESCVWRTVSSHSSHHPQEVLLAQFSLYVHKGGLKPYSFHFQRNLVSVKQIYWLNKVISYLSWVEWVTIVPRRFLRDHGDVTTEGYLKSGLCPTLIEWFQVLFIVHNSRYTALHVCTAGLWTVWSTVNAQPRWHQELYIEFLMPHIWPDQDSNAIPLSLELDWMSYRGRPTSAELLYVSTDIRTIQGTVLI